MYNVCICLQLSVSEGDAGAKGPLSPITTSDDTTRKVHVYTCKRQLDSHLRLLKQLRLVLYCITFCSGVSGLKCIHVNQVVCQTSYVYSLLMSTNKLETAAVRDCWLAWPHHDSTCTCTCTCTSVHVHVRAMLMYMLMMPGIGRTVSCTLGDFHLGLCDILWLFAAKGVVVHSCNAHTVQVELAVITALRKVLPGQKELTDLRELINRQRGKAGEEHE